MTNFAISSFGKFSSSFSFPNLHYNHSLMHFFFIIGYTHVFLSPLLFPYARSNSWLIYSSLSSRTKMLWNSNCLILCRNKDGWWASGVSAFGLLTKPAWKSWRLIILSKTWHHSVISCEFLVLSLKEHQKDCPQAWWAASSCAYTPQHKLGKNW